MSNSPENPNYSKTGNDDLEGIIKSVFESPEGREYMNRIIVTFPASYCQDNDVLEGFHRLSAADLLALAKGENIYNNMKNVQVGADWHGEYTNRNDSSVTIESLIEISQKVLKKLGIDWNSTTQNEVEEALKKVPDGRLTIE